jgi:hypothetical protein
MRQYACIDSIAAQCQVDVVARPIKSAQLQIRVTPGEKRELAQRARAAGLDLSSFVLGRLIPPRREAFGKLIRALGSQRDSSYVLAELGDLLADLDRVELGSVLDTLPTVRLDDLVANQLAAMVETLATKRGIRPPAWTLDIEPLRTPWFPTTLTSVRLHLLCNAPPAYRRRNLFVDSTFENRI